MAGEIIPYTDANQDNQFAPGLVAVWEDDGGNLLYVVGRYGQDGRVQWSDQVEFGAPTLNQGESVLSLNPQVAITPEIISQGGRQIPPSVSVVYQTVDSTTEYSANWRGSDGDQDYLINFRFSGDPGEDGILSGRGTNNSLGDGVSNELTAWTMEVFDENGNLVVSYDLDDQLKFDQFNFNFDANNNVILANADPEVFLPDSDQYGLNVGIDRTVEASGDLWQLASNAFLEKLFLEKTSDGSSDPIEIASSALNSSVFPISSTITDDTDLYSEFIAFSGDAATSNTLSDQNGNPITFNADTTVSPRYIAAGPETQFLTAETISSANAETNNSPTPGGSASGATLSTTPLGATQSFSISLTSAQRVIAGNVPLPNSIIPSGSNVGYQLSGSIGAFRSTAKQDGTNGKSTTDNYVVKTSLSLGQNDFSQQNLSPNNSYVNQALTKTNSSTIKRTGPQLSLTLGVNSNFSPDSNNELQYESSDLVITLGFGTFYQFRLSVPGTPKNLANAILQGDLKFGVQNFQVHIGVDLNTKQNPDGSIATPLLPIHLQGFTDQPDSIKLVNQTILSWLEGNTGGEVTGVSQVVLELLTRLSQTQQANDNNSLGQPLAGGAVQNIFLVEQLFLGLVYSVQILEQAYDLLFKNPDQYEFESFDIGVDWEPFLNGSIKALFATINGAASGTLDIGADLEFFDNGAVSGIISATESFSASANIFGFWKWSWSESFEQKATFTAGTPSSTDLASLLDEGNNGDVAVLYSPTAGTDKLYQTNGAVRADLASPTNQTLNDFTDDDDVALAFDPFSGEVLLAWVAAGSDSEKPLAQQDNIVVSRVFATDLDGSERGWDIPAIVNRTNDVINPGFNFNPSGEFFYTETSTGAIVDPSTIDIDSGQYTVNRALVWGFSETARTLNANSSPEDVQNSIKATDIFFSFSSRPAEGGAWSGWSKPVLVSEQTGTDRLPTLGQDPDGTLRIAWVSDTTDNGEPESIIFTSELTTLVDIDGSLGFGWDEPEIVVKQDDLRVSKLLLDTFGDQPALYWTDDIALSYSAFVLQDDPAWYYRLNDGGSNVAENIGNLGSSYNATYATTGDETAKILSDSALQNLATGDGDPDASAQFNSEDGSYLAIPLGNNNFGASFSLELWVKFDNTETDQILLQKVQSPSDDQPNPTPDWILKTGSNNNLIFDVGNGDISFDSLTANQWHYVVATFDATVNGTIQNPIATLYVDGVLAGQQQGAANPTTESIITAGQGLNAQLDELAIYNRILAISPNVETDDSGNVTNYSPGITGEGAITTHYNARFNPTENVVGDGTFFAVYDSDTDTWSDINRFAPQQRLAESEPLLQRAPTYDIVSATALEPDSKTDLYTQIELQRPSKTIQAIQVTGPAGSIWSTNWTIDGHLPLAIVQDGLIINDDSGFEQTLLGINETFDLYFQGTAQTDKYTIETFYSDKTSSKQSQSLLPNPSQSGDVGDIISAQGDIIEKEVSEFAQIDSGLTLDTSENYIGTTMVGGNFLNGETAITVGSPFANTSDGAILVLTAGKENLNIDNEGITLDPTKVPSGGKGVLITGAGGAQAQAGFSLAVGDINQDGTDDLVIGAPRGGDDNSGLVYVVSGKAITAGKTINLETDPDVYKVDGFEANSEGGYAIATGDLDGDQFVDDIVIGSPFALNAAGDFNSGKVYAVYGSSDFTGTTVSDSVNLIFSGEDNSAAGFSVDIIPSNSSNHSLNSDSHADVVIGAPRFRQDVTFNDDFENANAPQDAIDAILTASTILPDNNNITGSNTLELNTGRAYVLLGQANGISTENTEASLKGTNGFILDGSSLFNSDAEVGFSVSGAGDINSDGYEDLVIGAPSEAKGTGQVYVVGGRDDFSQFGTNPLQLAWESDLIITGPGTNARTGTTVSDAGDFNLDPTNPASKADDIVIGSPQAGYSAGQAHILFGNTADSNNPLWSDEYSTVFSLVPGSTQSIATFNESGKTTPNPNISTFILNGTNPKDGLIPSRGATDLNGDQVDDLLATSQLGNQIGILFGHPWLSDEGSLKIQDLKSDQGFFVGGESGDTGVLKLNGSNQSLELKGYKGISGTAPRTVEAWIKVPNSATGNQPIIAWGVNSPQEKWTIRLDNGQLRAEVNGGFIRGTSNLLDNQWHHIAVTWEDDGSPNITDAKLYVDGQLETIDNSGSQSINTSNDNNAEIGTTFSGAHFDGELDEVRIWDEARSQSEIQENRFITFDNIPENLAAYYTFDDLNADDSSANNHNGTAVGNPNFVEVSDRPNTISGSGKVVKLLGDLNLDGYDETLIAGNDNQSTVVFGASTRELLDGGLATLELTLTHEGLPQYAAVGDVNGDGFQDLVALLSGEPQTLALLTGSAELATQGNQDLSQVTTKSLRGTIEEILPAFDINGDGLNDWITQSKDEIALYLGQADGSIPDPIELELDDSLNLAELNLAAVNDVNRDGLSDLVALSNNGSVPFVILGESDISSGLTNQEFIRLNQLPETARTYQLTNAGDLNADGQSDFAVSLRGKGTVILATSRADQPSTYRYLKLTSGSSDSLEITTAGDVNGDGLDDLLIGRPTANSSAGEVFLVFGNDQLQDIANDKSLALSNLSLKATADNTIDGVAVLGLNITGIADSAAGTSVSGGADVNGDGLADYAVGAPDLDNLSYVLFGGDFPQILTQVGTLANDVLVGTATQDYMTGNAGSDFLLGNGGRDALSGGADNDVLTIADTNFRRINGGSGLDVLKLEGELDQSWNLTELAVGDRLQNLEVIDITGYGENQLFIDSTTVLNLSTHSNTVFIDADNGLNLTTDTILISEDFTNLGTLSGNGVTYDQYQAGEAILYVTPGATVTPTSFESLIIVTTDDVVNGDISSVNALILNPGADGISLREAIEATNNTAGAFSISFAEDLANSTFTLTQGQLTIKDDLTIAGAKNGSVTISGNKQSRVFHVNDGNSQTSKTVDLNHLTIKDGVVDSGEAKGGGILNNEDLRLNFSKVTGNEAKGNVQNATGSGGGVYNDGYLFVNESEILDNFATFAGGGIYNALSGEPDTESSAVIIASTISGNRSEAGGGGIANAADLIAIERSTISDNFAGAAGGGIGNIAGVVSITNSTISGNTGFAGAAIGSFIGGIDLINSTVADNRLLVSNFGYGAVDIGNVDAALLENSIISGTINGSDVSVGDNFVNVTTKGLNIVADGSFKNNKVLNVDPKLGSLQNNGGPTRTHKPEPDSPAIDAVAKGLPRDQRGVRRPQGSNFDIGAVEVQVNELNTTEDPISGFNAQPNLSISEIVVLESEQEALFTVVRTGDISQSLKVEYTTHDGSANAGQHFQPRSGEIIFAPNSDKAIVAIPITEDEALTQAQRNFEFRIIEDFETGAHEDDTIIGGDGDDVITDEGNTISKILAGELGDDAIRGGDGDDVLRGDSNSRDSGGTVGGNDILDGGRGNDRLGGKAGDDILLGGPGNDQLWGDDGDDILRGGLGNDTLTGDDNSRGQGSDIFVFAAGEGTDTIKDFELGTDFIGLADGLSFDDLTLTGKRILLGNETLVKMNINTSALGEADFIVF